MSKNSEKEKYKADQSTTKLRLTEEFAGFKKNIATMIAQQETRMNTKFKELENTLSGMFEKFRNVMSEDMTQVRREIKETSKKVIGVSDKVTELEKSVQ